MVLDSRPRSNIAPVFRLKHNTSFPDDPEAHAKFQDLSKAYNVLSDDAARARYDELGESGIAEQAQPQFDAMLFFR
jgi:DnaJ-class molecular chaperone